MLPDRVSNPGPLTYESGACATRPGLVKEEKSFKGFFLFLALGAILFNRAELFDQFLVAGHPKNIPVLKSVHQFSRGPLKLFLFYL